VLFTNPLVVRGVGRLLGGQTASYSGAGVIVSLVAFFGALIYLAESLRRGPRSAVRIFAVGAR
jgi:hypothetical protein